MRNNISLSVIVLILSAFILASCQKSINEETNFKEITAATNGNGVTPYQFERINEHNFFSQGWKEQQINIVSGVTTFSDLSDNVDIVCGPENTSDRRLINGCVTMNLPTGADPTLRRIRIRRGGYSGTLLSDLTELKYSTYVVQNCPTIMVLQIDVNGDEIKDFNIFWEPRAYIQSPNFPPLVFNTWQQWNPLDQGVWHIEAATVTLPAGLTDLTCTIPELIASFTNARIIDMPPAGNNGEGVRFTIGGTPRNLFDNTIGYFDALIIGTRDQQHSTIFDFTCSPGND